MPVKSKALHADFFFQIVINARIVTVPVTVLVILG